MRVLVTGSAGFIGHYVTVELESRGHVAVPFDRPDGNVLYLPGLMQAAEGVSAIVNLAGALGTSELIGAEHAAAEVNVLGALNVFDAAARARIPVVHIGTGHKGQPNPYAITKACAEDLAVARARWRGEAIAVVRAYHVYGAGQKPPPPHGPSPVRKIIPSFACRALSGMPIEVWGSGRNEIDLVHAADVARVLVDAIGGPYGEVTEAGTGKPVTVLQAAHDVAAACGADPEVVHLPMRAGEPEGARVVAASPQCPDAWPHRLDETVAWYRQWLASRS